MAKGDAIRSWFLKFTTAVGLISEVKIKMRGSWCCDVPQTQRKVFYYTGKDWQTYAPSLYINVTKM